MWVRERELLALGHILGHIVCRQSSLSRLKSSSSTLSPGMITSPLAASTRIFSRARNGIPKMASMFLSGATINMTGFVDVQDFEGMVILEMSFLLMITPLGVMG